MFDQFTIEDHEDDLRLKLAWPAVLEKVQSLVPPKMAERFLQTLRPNSLRGGTVILDAPSYFNAEWVRDRMVSELQSAFSENLGESIMVNISVKPMERAASQTQPMVAPVQISRPMVDTYSQSSGFQPMARCRFDRFIIGPSNRMAHAAAKAVAMEPGKKFNPLFIYGQSGLGKTHLLHAIANHIHATQPGMQVAYLSAQLFTEEFVNALQAGRIEQFRRSHRNVHIWLLDDIQFVVGKDRTQEEIFYIFNALQQTDRQIVFCSDRPPREMYLVDERLRSRFESGLVADIHPPDTETKSAIIVSKSEEEGLIIPTDVALYMAENLPDNIRILEGAIRKVLMEASLQSKAPDLDLVQQVIELHYSGTVSARPTQAIILDSVSRVFGIPTEQIRGSSRKAPIVLARHVAVYVTREITGDSWKHIGAQFGDRDHTSMMHAYQKISEMVVRDKEFANTLRGILRTLKPNS